MPPLIHVLEGEQRFPLRVIPALPQDTGAELPSPEVRAGCSTVLAASASATSFPWEVSSEEIE